MITDMTVIHMSVQSHNVCCATIWWALSMSSKDQHHSWGLIKGWFAKWYVHSVMFWFGSLSNTSTTVYKFWLSPHQVSHSPLQIYWCWGPSCVHQSMYGWTVFFLLNPCISCYLSKCVSSKFCDLIFNVQTQLQKIMCCERKAFRGPILIQGLLVAKIRLEDANEADVKPKLTSLSWQVRWPSTKGNMGQQE